METQTLNQIGLSGSEIKVYFALLKLESSTVGPIIKLSTVPDSKIYVILDKLKEKGLVSFVIKNNVKHFQASDPKNLIRLLNEKSNEIAEQKNKLEREIIPQIEARRKFTEDISEAIVYESYDGLRSAFNLIVDTLNRGDEYQVFMLGDALEDKRVIRFFQNYHKKRIERGINVRLLSNNMFRNTILKAHKYKGMKIRFTDKTLPIGTFVFKNHVMTIVWDEKPTAFVIKSRKNYDYYKEFFDETWENSKKYKR
ncbi:MAG: helix-turn-helix domain-containing protein [Candidatus Aenigmatarchaeota archaeon]